MNSLTAIVHLTNNCNMGCVYCYTGSSRKKKTDVESINFNFEKSLNVLFSIVEQLVNYNNGKKTRIIFHGGEPLLINKGNWHKMLVGLEKKSNSLIYGIQTNGTLLDQDYLEIFDEFKVSIGISLDGYGSIHDKTRIFKNGKQTFNLILNNINQCIKSNVAFGTLLTLNRANICFLNDIYHYFRDNKIPFAIRPIFKNKNFAKEELLISPNEYYNAVSDIFNLWFTDEKASISLIEEFTNIIAQFIHPIEGLVSCSFAKNCAMNFISIDLNGDLFPCNRFYNDWKFYYGNILENNLDYILNSCIAKSLSNRWEILSNTSCAGCEVSKYCYGGCPANAYYYFNDYYTKDYYCPAYKMKIKHIYEQVKNTIK